MAAVPTLNIKDPEVYDLARELARRRRTSMTAAVKQSLEQSLAVERKSREGIAEKLLEIGRRAAAMPEPFLTDDDLYDERGLPR
jgi:antitoxin VapB